MNNLVRCLAILALISSSALANVTKPSCQRFCRKLSPCVDYIRQKEDAPSPDCCSAIKEISSDKYSRWDRKRLCRCLKKLLKTTGPCDANRIPLLPEKCGACITFPPVTNSTDCRKYSFPFLFYLIMSMHKIFDDLHA